MTFNMPYKFWMETDSTALGQLWRIGGLGPVYFLRDIGDLELEISKPLEIGSQFRQNYKNLYKFESSVKLQL